MQGWRERRDVWKALSITRIVTQRLQVEEREAAGKGRESAYREGEEQEEEGRVCDNHDSNVYPLSVLIVSFLLHYLSFQKDK